MIDVLVVGGGPTGLLLAAELRLAGAAPLVLEAGDGTERRHRSFGLRGINGRSVQTLALRGLTVPLAAAQQEMLDRWLVGSRDTDEIAGMVRTLHAGRARGHFGGLPLMVGDGETTDVPPPFLLKQHVLERIIAERAAQDVPIHYGHTVSDIVDEGDAVTVTLASGRTLHARYVVGCDGGHSTVRGRAGIAFPGTEATMTGRSATAELDGPGLVASMRGPRGLLNTSLVQGEVATLEFDGGPPDRDTPVTAEELRASVHRVTGVDVTVTRFEGGIRYGDNTRQAATYRVGRVLLAGDAAHVHSPIGGQGLNLGLQDAMNLGWKLALVARGLAPESLLDTYTAERHPVGARVLRNTRAQVALMRPGAQVDALREVLAEVLGRTGARDQLIDMANNTDIDYAPDAGHPAVGRFAPVPLPDGSAVLLDPFDSAAIRSAAHGHVDRVRLLPADGPTAMLVRPDGYIAWASDHDDPDGLAAALSTWLGAPRFGAAPSPRLRAASTLP
ncbi:MAG: FAD-dependent monooxygenase [Actinocatenispora sp.]